MKTNIYQHCGRVLLVAVSGLLLPEGGEGAGIPEPSLILYGTVRNTSVNNERVTWGNLTWRFRNTVSGQTVDFTVPVRNVLDQFSYVLEVPCEQVISGQVSTKALNLTGTSALFDRSQVFYEGVAVSFVTSTQSWTLLSARDRGRVERVDLEIAAECLDWDGNGLCDDWELYYLGYIGVNPEDDDDGDGQSNRAEFKAGTDPLDPQSVFRFMTCERVDASRIRVEWQSADGRYYTLLRYPSLLSTNSTVVQSRIFATQPMRAWVDTNAPPTGPCFYRLQLEP